jgi:hypothetical protein
MLGLLLFLGFLALAFGVIVAWANANLWAMNKVYALSGRRDWLFLLLWMGLIVLIGVALTQLMLWTK